MTYLHLPCQSCPDGVASFIKVNEPGAIPELTLLCLDCVNKLEDNRPKADSFLSEEEKEIFDNA